MVTIESNSGFLGTTYTVVVAQPGRPELRLAAFDELEAMAIARRERDRIEADEGRARRQGWMTADRQGWIDAAAQVEIRHGLAALVEGAQTFAAGRPDLDTIDRAVLDGLQTWLTARYMGLNAEG